MDANQILNGSLGGVDRVLFSLQVSMNALFSNIERSFVLFWEPPTQGAFLSKIAFRQNYFLFLRYKYK